MSSVDENVIRGFHTWKTLSSVDGDDGHGWSNCQPGSTAEKADIMTPGQKRNSSMKLL